MSERLMEKYEKEAREWFVLLQSGHITESDRCEFSDWRAKSNHHEHAYQQLKSLWQSLDCMQGTPELELLKRSIEPGFMERLINKLATMLADYRSRVWQALRFVSNPYMLGSAVAALLVAICAPLLYQYSDTRESGNGWAQYTTQTAEIQEIALEDGSRVTLGAGSSIRVLYNRHERSARLVQGQAFFDIAKDPQRPFTVHADQATVQVLGTQFDINKARDKVYISVLEGEVKVTLDDKGARAEKVLAQKPELEWKLISGQKIATDGKNNEKLQVYSVDVSELGAWRQGRLVYRGASLLEVISDANRYYNGSITLASKQLNEYKVSASFRSDQIELMLNMLADTLPVNVYHESENRIVIEPKKDGG